MTITGDPTVPQIFPNFPPLQPWLDDIDRISRAGEVVMAVSGGILDATQDPELSGQADTGGGKSRGSRYTRRILGTGQDLALNPSSDLDGQLLVSAYEMFIGRAGEQRFQFFKGDLGSYAQRVLRLQVQLGRRAPKPTGGLAPRMPDPSESSSTSRSLWLDSYLVWSALLAMALGGVTDQTGAVLTPCPIPQDNILVGPMSLSPAQGGIHSAKCVLELQL